MITIATLAKDRSTIIIDIIQGRTQALRRQTCVRREDPITIFFLL